MSARIGILLSAVLWGLLPAAASAQGYPSRLVTMIVPFPAGSGPDVYARLIGGALAPRLGQSVVIENHPGAGGTLGGRTLVRAAPDGYTIMFGSTSSVLIAPTVAKEQPYDPVKAFAPVIQVGRGPFILSVRSDLPIHNLQELIAYAKANPGKLNYGSSGFGSLHHLATEMLKHSAKIDLTHIPYPGGAQSWTALQSGVVDLIFDSMPGPISALQSGKARPIAVTGTHRLGPLAAAPMLGSVPTFAEQGAADVDVTFWFGIVAPAGTPSDVIAKLNAELASSIDDPAVKARFVEEGIDIATGTAHQFADVIAKGAVQWGEVVASLGLKQQ
jgi:tripartite-type tricarboxylate transporter receptor subunit TctC